MNILNLLVWWMLSEWPPIENQKDYYLNYYLIKVKQGDKYSKITPVEEKIIKYR